MRTKGDRYIWLFGENTGESADNNSFYLWRYIVNNHDEVFSFFVVRRTPSMLKKYRDFSQREKAYIVWRNSFEHFQLFKRADLLFVSVSYRDVQPDRIAFKSYRPQPTTPLVYLQHGTLAMKKIDYASTYANNTMLRFLIYNPNISEALIKKNGFRKYQIYDGVSHPRYSELARRSLEYTRNHADDKGTKILWFITWREYLDDGDKVRPFIDNILDVLCDSKLQKFLAHEDNEMTICLHRYFAKKDIAKLKSALANFSGVRVSYAGELDVMDLLVENTVLITDYSSVGFDFTFLGKPVILYQPDLEEYSKRRDFYCDISDLKKIAIDNTNKLVEKIVNRNYAINSFFNNNMHSDLDLCAVAKDKYNEDLFAYFYSLEQRSISFFGYDFSGIGGTVFATKALAEGLMERGYLVRAYTLKQVYPFTVPAGLALTPATRQYQRRLSNKIIEKLIFSKRHHRYLQYDPRVTAIAPLAGLQMDYWMRHVHSSVIVSTRESLHLFFRENSSPFIEQKIYFFHTSSESVDSLFPGVLSLLQKGGVEKAAFVTRSNMEALASINGFTNYQEYGVIGNCLDSSRSITFEEIGTSKTKDVRHHMCVEPGHDKKIHCAYMLRISKERKRDIEDMLSFADYLKTHNVQDIVIDLYGTGNYVDECLSMLKHYNLDEIVVYRGETHDVKLTLQESDMLVDFSNEQSFGMPYIEGVLNGKAVLCKHNEGSDEVLRDIPEAFYSSNEELLQKIYNSTKISPSELRENYQLISQRYSRTAVVDRFIELVER